MYNSRKLPLDMIPSEMTEIWSCMKESCNGWIRDNYAFETVPTCNQCMSPMNRSMKSLPILLDSSYDLKLTLKRIAAKKEND